MTPAAWIILSLLLLWSFAEAFAWPVVPDAALAAVVLLAPGLAVSGTVAVVAGTAAGGAVAIALLRRGAHWPLPLVTPTMKRKVHRWLEHGAIGLAYQPLTTVPYKAFVVEATRRGFGIPRWALFTTLFRGPRMAAISLISARAAATAERLAPPGSAGTWKLVVLALSGAAFVVGWRVVLRLWARAESPANSVDVQPI
jgi:hypothetical protein